MLAIPDIRPLDSQIGNIKHLPDLQDIPEEFRLYSNSYFATVSHWFHSGARRHGEAVLEVNGQRFAAKTGVDFGKAVAAIRSCINSNVPEHEHKMAGCAFMLSEWFERVE